MTAELTPEQEEEVVRGLLPFEIDGKTHLVPELKWKANRDWQDQMQVTFATLAGVPGDDILAGARAMGDAQREIIRAYDATGALGDLEDATETEIDAIYNRLAEVSFPQSQRRTLLLMNMVRQAVESAQANMPSSPSPTGTSAPTPLKPRSRTARSASSTARRKSA